MPCINRLHCRLVEPAFGVERTHYIDVCAAQPSIVTNGSVDPVDCDNGVLAAGISGSLDASATARKARSSGVGKAFPRFSARRSIPAQAVELKKYCGGIESLTSTCDNEHTAASLGQSVILGILDPPCRCSLGSKHTTSVRPFSPCWDERITFAGKASKEAAECSRLVAK